MVSTKGLCCTIALLCVIVPMIVGHVMPADRLDDQIGYESGSRVNITSDLINSGDYVAAESVSVLNNYDLLQASPVQTSGTITSIPALGPISTTTHAAGIIDLSAYTMYTEFEPAEYVETNFTITTAGGSDSYATLSWDPANNRLIAYNINNYPEIITGYTSISAAFSYVTREQTLSTTVFVQPEYGSYIKTSAITWNNGSYNTGATFIITDNNYNSGDWSGTFRITSVDPEYNPSEDEAPLEIIVTFGVSSNSWFLTANNQTVNLGTYKQVALRLDGQSNSISMSGLVYNANLNTTIAGRELAAVSISPVYEDDPDVTYSYYPESIAISGSANSRMVVYCSSANVITGSQPVIKDNLIPASNYFPDHTFSVELSSTAIYGSKLTISGQELAVDGNKITFTDLNDEEHTERINGLILLAVYDSTTDNYDLFLNGYPFREDTVNTNIQFGGMWNLTVMIYEVTEYTYSEYVYNFSTLNISHNEYCLVGLITAVLSFVAAAMIGRRSGTKTVWCMLIAGLAFIIYLGMFE